MFSLIRFMLVFFLFHAATEETTAAPNEETTAFPPGKVSNNAGWVTRQQSIPINIIKS